MKAQLSCFQLNIQRLRERREWGFPPSPPGITFSSCPGPATVSESSE